MKLSQAYIYAKSSLKEHNIDSYSIDALVLMCHCLNLTKEEIIFCDENKEISDDDFQKIKNLILRRINREPISHIINHREFFGLDFYVDKNVLDPRADSEILVETTINLVKNFDKKLKALEIGVGSGCLSISVLKNIENLEIIGVDISDEALKICQKNIDNHNLNDRFKIFKSDLFDNIKKEKFDFIISNPPYIKTKDIEDLELEVKKYEPRQALDGGENGLDFYEKIALLSKDFLNEKGFVILEIGYDQKQDVINIFQENGYILKDSKTDLARRDRVLCFEKLLSLH